MIAHLRNIRLAPKKLNLVAGLVRRLPVGEAIAVLSVTPKKGARILERVLRSAVANAAHNEKQKEEDLYIRTLLVNRASHLRRGVPRARGSVRPIRKFLSHVTVELGVRVPEEKKREGQQKHGKQKSVSSS